MKNYFKILLSVIFVFFSTFIFAENGERVKFPNGNFSFCPPAGWQVTEFPGLKYDVVIGPVEEGFSANMVFIDESYAGNLKEYIDLNLVNLVYFIQNYELADRKPIKFNSGISGEYIIIKHEQYGYNLKQATYFFPAGNNKYFVITCTVLEKFFDKFLPLFENSVKTFETF
jgi:hypothetical protein